MGRPRQYANAQDRLRAHRQRAREKPTHFVGIDGEGITEKDGQHRYVLLACGDQAIEDSAGLHWETIFSWLWGQQDRYPAKTAYVGFYLGYDFTQWLRSIDEQAAWKLLTKKGRAARKTQHGATRSVYLEGEQGDWEIDMLNDHRLSLRPVTCSCRFKPGLKCPHKKPQYMHICDTGPLFQQSFLKTIDPAEWQGHSPCTPEEYELVKEGKERRATAVLDDKMRQYNLLEVDLLARVMTIYEASLAELDIRLRPGEWYGAGALAAKWLDLHGAPKFATTWEPLVAGPEMSDPNLRYGVATGRGKAYEAALQSYYGGWFEIMCHGPVPGTTWEYDITSAYPYIISSLPCVCGEWRRTKELLPDQLCLLYARVEGHDPYVGAHMHRSRTDRIHRPTHTTGWIWAHELAAGVRAGVISTYHVREGWVYQPCGDNPPFTDIRRLFRQRLDVGTKSAQGKAIKLVMNSVYGKLCQQVGSHPYQNMIWASLITSQTRTMILDSIATHPNKTKDLVMVATDAVFFRSPHSALPCPPTKELGAWEAEPHEGLVIFKPGVYWDSAGKKLRTRGMAPKDLSPYKDALSLEFQRLAHMVREGKPIDELDWPRIDMLVSFSMVSAKAAATRNKWWTAGQLADGATFAQSAYPFKRGEPYWDHDVLRTSVRTDGGQSKPYCASGQVADISPWETPEGPSNSLAVAAIGSGDFD